MFARVQTNASLARDQANVLVVRSIFSTFLGVVKGTPRGILAWSVSISLLSLRHPLVLCPCCLLLLMAQLEGTVVAARGSDTLRCVGYIA